MSQVRSRCSNKLFQSLFSEALLFFSEPRLVRLLKLMLYAQTQLAGHLSAPVMRFDGGEWKLSQGD